MAAGLDAGNVAAPAGSQTSRIQPPVAPPPRSNNGSAGATPAQPTSAQQAATRLANVAVTSGRQLDVNA